MRRVQETLRTEQRPKKQTAGSAGCRLPIYRLPVALPVAIRLRIHGHDHVDRVDDPRNVAEESQQQADAELQLQERREEEHIRKAVSAIRSGTSKHWEEKMLERREEKAGKGGVRCNSHGGGRHREGEPIWLSGSPARGSTFPCTWRQWRWRWEQWPLLYASLS